MYGARAFTKGEILFYCSMSMSIRVFINLVHLAIPSSRSAPLHPSASSPQTLLPPLLPTPNFLSLIQSLLSHMLHIQRVPLHERTTHQRRRRQTTHDQPHHLQAIRICLHQLRLLRQLIPHRLDNLHQTRCIPRILVRSSRQQRIFQKLNLHLILEDDAADGDSNRLSERAEEGEESDGEGDILVRAGGLQAELHGGEEDARPEAGDEVQEDPGGDGGVHVEEHHQPAAERGDGPPGPHHPAVPSRLRDGDPRDHGRRRDGEAFREGGHAGNDGGVSLDGLVVQRDIVDDRPEHHAMDDRVEIRDARRPVREDGNRHQGLRGHEALVQAKSHDTRQPEDQGDQRVPAAPGEHDAAPGDGDDRRGGGRQEQQHPEPIHAGELRGELRALEAEVEEDRDHDEADAAEGEVEPEDPAPGDCDVRRFSGGQFTHSR